MSHRIRRSAAAAALVGTLATLALAGVASPASADDGHDRNDRREGRDPAATVYSQTNDATGNAVLAFREVNGSLTNVGSYATGGFGAGNGLGSQGAVVADDDHLLAVNAGSNQVSLFSINDDGSLTLDDVESSAGVRPVSVTARGGVAYVVNVTSRNVAGFRIEGDDLRPIAGSTQSLPGDGAAQISFDAKGSRLVVTEKATNTIDVLPVGRRGAAGTAVSHPSTGATPFGFAIDRRNNVIVSNANGGAVDDSSTSSYRLSGSTDLTPVTSAAGTTQTAACWVALSENQKFAYVANAGSGSISSYAIARDGALTLLEPAAATPGAGVVDLAVADDTLFALAGGTTRTITAYRIGGNGTLTATGSGAIPGGLAGLATN